MWRGGEEGQEVFRYWVLCMYVHEEVCIKLYCYYIMIQWPENARSLQENLQKLQRERQELQDLMNGTISEVTAQGTFSTLSAWITRSHEEKLNMERTILK